LIGDLFLPMKSGGLAGFQPSRHIFLEGVPYSFYDQTSYGIGYTPDFFRLYSLPDNWD